MAQKKNKGIHILVISQYFYPEQFRINDICLEWIKRGYKVTVLTGIPNYPAGNFFPGYSWIKKRQEKWKGIDIIRIPLIPRGHSVVGMGLNYYSFPFFGWWWNRFNRVDADMVFSFETSPMMQVKIGCGYAKKHNVPHFLYAQDLWPENLISVTGIKNRCVIGPIDRMVDRIYKQTDKILVTSPSFVNAVVNRKKQVDSNKVIFWPQYAEDFYRPLNKTSILEIPNDDSFKIAFTGNIGFAQGLSVLPETAALLQGDNVKFIIIGGGRYQERLMEEIDKHNVRSSFVIIPRQPAERIPELLSACDAGFISFSNDPLWEKTIPAKLQSYMACGKAIVASAAGETARVINEARCGVCCKIGNAQSLADGIRGIIQSDVNELGENARAYFEEHFDKTMLMDAMDVMIEEALS